MGIVASTGFVREDVTPGVVNAVYCEMFDVGAQPIPEQYRQADRPPYRRQVIVVWQTDELDSQGNRKEVMQWVGLSAGSNSTFAKWLKSLVGPDFKKQYSAGGGNVDIERAFQDNPRQVLMVAANDNGKPKVESVAKGKHDLDVEDYAPLADRGDYFVKLQAAGLDAASRGLHRKQDNIPF